MQLPESFVERTRSLLGEEYEAFAGAIDKEQSVSIRLNRRKTQVEPQLQRVPWCEVGFYLEERPNFTFDPLFHSGVYYVQEASSMFLDRVIRQYVNEPVRYLDLCASPGGKTTLAINSLPEGSFVVANEIDRKRCNILAENIVKWGSPYAMVVNNQSADFTPLTHYFDVILTDVPCSGEGMFRKDPQAITEWSEQNVMKCAERQKEIIGNIWDALRPGGILIYSTCTYNTEENEQMIEYIKSEYGAQSLPVDIDKEWGIHGALFGESPVYRFMPHLTKGEGLFMAVLRKPEEEYVESRSQLVRDAQRKSQKKGGKNQRKEAPQSVPKEVKAWVRDGSAFEFESANNVCLAYPKEYYEEIKMLSHFLNPVVDALVIGSVKGKDIAPEHNLAMSDFINDEAFEAVEVSLMEAVSFLRREALVLSPDVNKGYVLLQYKGRNLGFVKNIGNRSNNLYPQEWRIRTGYNPEEMLTLEL